MVNRGCKVLGVAAVGWLVVTTWVQRDGVSILLYGGPGPVLMTDMIPLAVHVGILHQATLFHMTSGEMN